MKIDHWVASGLVASGLVGLLLAAGCTPPPTPPATRPNIAASIDPPSTAPAPANPVAEWVPPLTSPDGAVRIQLAALTGRLTLSATLKDAPALDASPMSFTVDDVDLAADSTVVHVERYTVHETYPMVGGHRVAVNNGAGQRITLGHKNGTRFTLDVRAYNDAIAFRFVVPDAGRARTPDEATTFVLPGGSDAWYHGIGGHYEGDPKRYSVDQIQAGDWLAPPVTFLLPSKTGYATITEANLVNYPGMALQADGKRGFVTGLGHRQPPGKPFLQRYRATEARRLAVPAAIAGEIVTPWRVVMLAANLDTLVNCDVVPNLCPPPDAKLFPQGSATEWVRPGRAVWRYLDGGPETTAEGMKAFCDDAAKLGFEYNVLEGFWARWSPEDLKSLCDYAKARGIGIWVWAHSKNLHSPEDRNKLYDRCVAAGVVGMKIDFFDHEAKEVIDLYTSLQREAAERHLLVNFHGANKPTGENRTWPNELTREAVHGMESRNVPSRAAHDATLPFTRCLVGPADYTPVLFSNRRADTTWAHQVANTITLSSPLLTYAATPQNILTNPCAQMIKSIPSVWDETVVLAGSEIGECAAFARRSGSTWFVAISNGPAARSLRLPLSFMDEGEYHSLTITDTVDDAAAVLVKESALRSREVLQLQLRPGGGFVARYTRAKPGTVPPSPASKPVDPTD